MTPQEETLIKSLFDRLRGVERFERDREAEALIKSLVRATPDVHYLLVQTLLVQEQALAAAIARGKEAEERLNLLDDEARQKSRGSTSFLGGLFSGRSPDDTTRGAPVSASPVPQGNPAGYSPWQAAAPANGGFLQSAMMTAAGVAGGMLAAGAIRDLFGGFAHGGSNFLTGPDQAWRNHDALTRQDAQDDAQADAYDDAGDFGGTGE